MNEHVTFNGSPTADGYYTTLSPNEVTIDSSDEGSGGSSSDGDFSIAKITCPNGLPGYIPCVMDDDGVAFAAPFALETHEVPAILYKGRGYYSSSVDASLIEIEGAIEQLGPGPGVYMITGDCTITITTVSETYPSL